MSWEQRISEKKERIKKQNQRSNNERFDEKFVLNAVLNWSCQNGLIVEDIVAAPNFNDSKPDYSFNINGVETILEITQSGSGFVFNNGEIENRTEKERSFLKNCDKLQELISTWVALGQTIFLIIDRPINRFNKKLIAALNEKLKTEFYNQFITEIKELVVEGEIFIARSTQYYKQYPNIYSPLKVMYGPSLGTCYASIVNDLKLQAEFILKSCIEKKEEKYGHLNLPKWFAILNCNPLISISDYKNTYKELNLVHLFDKIFIIDEKTDELF